MKGKGGVFMRAFLLVSAVKELASTALALLIAALAMYLGVKLLGKFAKFVIIVVTVILVLWFILSDNSILSGILPFGR